VIHNNVQPYIKHRHTEVFFGVEKGFITWLWNCLFKHHWLRLLVCFELKGDQECTNRMEPEHYPNYLIMVRQFYLIWIFPNGKRQIWNRVERVKAAGPLESPGLGAPHHSNTLLLRPCLTSFKSSRTNKQTDIIFFCSSQFPV